MNQIVRPIQYKVNIFINLIFLTKISLQTCPMHVCYGRKTSGKIYTILKQGIRTNIINDWFIKLCKPPCNTTYYLIILADRDASFGTDFGILERLGGAT